LLVLVCACAGRARAFSDPLSFGDDVKVGGGGGRYFTGSVGDGYGCNVCHSGGESPVLEVLGLPTHGYVPGGSYEISIAWPVNIEHVGLALEITDARGAAAGLIRLPPPHEVPDAERCEPIADGVKAGVLHESPSRTVLQVPDCGARRVRFLWTVPAAAPELVLFSGGIVASDGQADVDHDGVTMFSRTLTRSGAPAVTVLHGSCSVRTGPRASSRQAGWLFAVALLALSAARHLRAPRAMPSGPCA
jgi:hypothetical protein